MSPGRAVCEKLLQKLRIPKASANAFVTSPTALGGIRPFRIPAHGSCVTGPFADNRSLAPLIESKFCVSARPSLPLARRVCVFLGVDTEPTILNHIVCVDAMTRSRPHHTASNRAAITTVVSAHVFGDWRCKPPMPMNRCLPRDKSANHAVTR